MSGVSRADESTQTFLEIAFQSEFLPLRLNIGHIAFFSTMRPALNQIFIVSFIVFLISVVGVAHAASYYPAVSAGQWAVYKPLYNTCVGDPILCGSSGNGLGDTNNGTIRIVRVFGSSITLTLETGYTNRTIKTLGVLVDVSSGTSNVTSFTGMDTGTPTDYFVLAGGLQGSDKIWNTPTAPTLNQTETRTVLGSARIVSFLNHTSSFGAPGYASSISTGFAFDQQSGVFIELAVAIDTSGPYGGSFHSAFAFGMVNTNIWSISGGSNPDFAISSSGGQNFQTGASGTSTITLTAQNGFSSTIILEVIAPSGLQCSLSTSSLPGYGASSLTCKGQPGSYTVTVKATSGSTTKSKDVPVQVNSLSTVSQPSNDNTMLLIYAGIGVAAIVALLATYFVIRRRSSQPTMQPSVLPTSSTA